MTKNRHTYIVALFFLLVLLSVASPYLHNHEADLVEHEDCVAYMLSAIFSLGIIAVFLFISLFNTEITHVHKREPFHYFSFCTTRPTRAPPFSF